MANKKPGRPRSSNYEKNLEKRLRQAERKLEQGSDGVYRDIQKSGNHPSSHSQGSSGNNHSEPEMAQKVNEKLLHMAKSFLGYVDQPGISGRYGKEPIFTHEQYQVMTDGVRMRPVWRVDYGILRQASMGTSLISAIHTIRVEDLQRFARISRKEGLWFAMEDEDEEITDEMEVQMKKFGKFIKYMGDKVEGWSERDHLFPVFEMMIRDQMTLDGIAIWIVKNAFGKPIELKYLDPATIFPVDPSKGYRGDKSIRFVQMIDNQVVETFGPDELLWMHKNNLSDVQSRGWGFSPLEATMLDLVGVINSLKYNRDKFTRQPPPGFMSVMGDLSEDAIEALSIQWREMVSGLDDNHAIPIMSSSAGEIKWTPLNLSNDMLFKDFMQWLVSFVLMAHGMDQAELGLRLLGSQTLSEANQDDKVKASMTRPKVAMLRFFESVFDRVRDFFPEYSSFLVEFKGKDPEDESKKLEKITKEGSLFKTIDEIRVEQDLPTLGEAYAEMYGEDVEEVKKAGAIIMSPTFTQHYMSMNQPPMDDGMGMEEGIDEGMGDEEEGLPANLDFQESGDDLEFEDSGQELDFEDDGLDDSFEEDEDLKF